jgi:D-arabinose 1-dehydrogenase-like Zn-dependent alcohol dehydrogenase
MLDFVANTTLLGCRSDSYSKVNEAYERLLKSDVKYRFSIRHGFAEVRMRIEGDE